MNENIFEEIYKNILSISINKHGCCVLQKIFGKSNSKEKENLIKNLINNCETLIKDQFGNYIIQFIIILKNEEINEKIINVLIKNLEEYSKQKFSSNVVEKILECSSDKKCEKIIDILEKNENMILNILFDKYGNYVLQKALQRSNKNTKKFILNIIYPHLYKLKNYSFGFKLYSKLILFYNSFNSDINTNINEEKINSNKVNYCKKQNFCYNKNINLLFNPRVCSNIQ